MEGGQEGAILAGRQQGAAVVPQVHGGIVHHPPLAKLLPQLRSPQEASGGIGRQRLDPVPKREVSEERERMRAKEKEKERVRARDREK